MFATPCCPLPFLLSSHEFRPSLLSWPGQGSISLDPVQITCPFSVDCGAHYLTEARLI